MAALGEFLALFNMTMGEKAGKNRKEAVIADNTGGNRKRKAIALEQKVDLFLHCIC